MVRMQGTHIARDLLLQAFRLLLRPVIGFAIRHALKLQDLIDVAKSVFIEVAEKQLAERGENVTTSRLSIITGVHRRDVNRLLESSEPLDNNKGLVSQVISQWQTDRRFVHPNGKPRALSFGFMSSDFHALVELISKDLNPATVLFELERVGLVRKSDKALELVNDIYIPKGDILAGFSILREDLETLLLAAEENILFPPHLPNLHLRCEYTKVRDEDLPALRAWLLKEGNAFQRRVRDYLADRDQDVNPDLSFTGATVRVAVGCFSKILAEKER